MINLASGKCVACRREEPTLTDAEIADLHLHVPAWQILEVDGVKRIERIFKLKNFVEAIAFTNKSRLSRRAAAAGLSEEANSTSMPVTSMMRRTKSSRGSPT